MRTLLLILIGLIGIDRVNACQCIPLTFDEEVKISSTIFRGLVISADNYQFDIEIIQIWKGDFEAKVFHLTQGTTSCEKRIFELGKEYLFYVRDNSVFNCSRTNEFNFTADTELLDLKFNKVGDKSTIESSTLTDRQLTVLKNILTHANIIFPTNNGEVKISYAYEGGFVDKINFFERIRWEDSKIKLYKVNDKANKDNQSYILWTGNNWDKSLKKLKRSL
ncbi:MAG: hypothetical protein IM631_18555 [Cytophagales bacterium]|jgi:hypothetical protein|nr:hypothetical protein [Cytophagales bacterium]MCA6373372.1 hypothetical protein [Cytophagales bacterium]MCA6377366.1 hypothetical protein [Cytophagales bacterium]MCA6386008.1 hypothetical protein [Cytophagales bacterium]